MNEWVGESTRESVSESRPVAYQVTQRNSPDFSRQNVGNHVSSTDQNATLIRLADDVGHCKK